MSFSLWVKVSHNDGYTQHFDIVDGQTYNLSPMWRACGLVGPDASTRELGGKTCSEMRVPAIAALVDYLADTGKYEALDPPNGWGNHEGFFNHGLVPFAREILRHPTGVIGWSG